MGLGSIGQGGMVDFKDERAVPDSVRRVIDSSIVLLRTYALHRDRPDWNYVRERAYELAGQATRWEELGPAISWLFESVDDHHGWLVVKDSIFRWQRAEQPFLSEKVRQAFAAGPRVVGKVLTGEIGYLRVPSMVMDTAQYQQAAQALLDSLYSLQARGARKFIIDLRLDAGGTMFPMLAGLSPLLGNGEFIGNADHKGHVLNMVRMRDGVVKSADGGVDRVDLRGLPVLKDAPVVVITGHGTASAGECVAIAFKGRKHTWFIGEPTGGSTTANAGHWIVDGQVGIVIAETMVADRAHQCYPRNLVPDEWVPGGDEFTELMLDKKLQAASYKLQGVKCEM